MSSRWRPSQPTQRSGTSDSRVYGCRVPHPGCLRVGLGYPTKDIHPEPAEGFFSYSSLPLPGAPPLVCKAGAFLVS
jgi:hypothetical protein